MVYFILACVLLNVAGCAVNRPVSCEYTGEKMVDNNTRISEDEALKALETQWLNEIKPALLLKAKAATGENEKKLFERLLISGRSLENRIENILQEKENRWYSGNIIAYDNALKNELQSNDREARKRNFPGLLYFDGNLLAPGGKCWELKWAAMMVPGFTAYIDLFTGRVLAIKVLIEGI